MKTLGTILAILQALKALVDRLIDFKKEGEIDEAIETKDQRPAESAIGSTRVGGPSSHGDGVRERPLKDRR